MKVVKRNGLVELFDGEKIKSAVKKSAQRVNMIMSDEELKYLVFLVKKGLFGTKEVSVDIVHNLVEMSLDKINNSVSKSYKDYRNYKNEYGQYLMKDIEEQVNETLHEVDRSNSNSNTRYISTKRTEIAQTFSKEMYQKMYLSKDVIKAIKDGFIYIHDIKDLLLPQFNCCLTDVGTILKGGFELEGYNYTEPKDVKTAIGQISDVVQIISSQHYGGNTTPEIDKVIAPYYEKTINKLKEKYKAYGVADYENVAIKDAYIEMKQALQGLEIKLNTVVSARGSYPFTTFSFGNCSNSYEKDVAKAILEVRMEGHGEVGKKKNTIFPKLVFLHNEEKHCVGGELEDLFNLAVKCSSKCMYPDYIGWNHRHEGKYISPMGCRAFLSDYRDENGELVFTGRANIGAVSLNLPMIYQYNKTVGGTEEDFFKLLNYYLEMIRNLHLDRYEYLGKAKASSNPLMFTQGGAYKGFLKPDDEIKPLLDSWTASFGVTALNELEVLANGKRLAESTEFAKKVMTHINNMVDKFKEEDGKLYAIYNTPKLCGWV